MADQYYECMECGESIPADSIVPDECPNCGETDWYEVS